MRVPFRRGRRGERGVVIIWTAFFLLAMLGFVAIGIDVAKLMATRTELQNAADAAALSGASAINFQNGTIIADTAIVRAKLTAARNKAFVNSPVSVTLLGGDISFPTTKQIKVTVRRSAASDGSMVTHVAQVLGLKTLDVQATAVAQVEPTGTPCDGLVPMAPVNPDPSGWFKPSCASTYTLKAGSGDGQTGNYELLDFPDCAEGACADIGGGGAEIRCLAEHGYGCCIDLNTQWVLSKPGNTTGPFRQGMQARFDADADRRENICYSEYRGTGQRVVRVPIVKSYQVSGRKYVQIIAFSAFFLRWRPASNGDLKGQFIYDITVGDPGPGNGTLFSIRLIQ